MEIGFYWVINEWDQGNKEKAKTIWAITEEEREEPVDVARRKAIRGRIAEQAMCSWALLAEKEVTYKTALITVKEEKITADALRIVD